jgi:hypothetical protein
MLVGGDGGLTIEAKTGGLLGVAHASRQDQFLDRETVSKELAPAEAQRTWKLISGLLE